MPFCPNCRDEFEDWVEVCPDCKATLVDELPALPKTPFPPPVFKETYEKFTKCNWLHHTLVAVVTIVVLALLLTSQPWSNISEEKFLSSYVKAKSGQMNVFSYNEEGTEELLIELSWIYPDRYRGKFLPDEDCIEFIIINNKYYSKGANPEHLLYDRQFHFGRSQIRYIYDKAKNGLIDSLTEIRGLPDETFRGIDCLHYIARADMNYTVDQLIKEHEAMQLANPDFFSDEEIEEDLLAMETLRNAKITVEYWIAKEDGLFRQLIINTQELLAGDRVLLEDSHTRVMYYNVNYPITITPPEKLFGGLLPGWHLIEPFKNIN